MPCRSTPPPHRCHKTTKHRISAMILHSAGGGGWANEITLTGGGGGGNILTSEWEAQRRRGGRGAYVFFPKGVPNDMGGGGGYLHHTPVFVGRPSYANGRITSHHTTACTSGSDERPCGLVNRMPRGP